MSARVQEWDIECCDVVCKLCRCPYFTTRTDSHGNKWTTCDNGHPYQGKLINGVLM